MVAAALHKYSDNRIQRGMAIVSFVCAMLQVMIIDPKTTKALKVFNKIRKEEGEESESKEFKKARGKFGMWHGISLLVNLTTLLLQTRHIYWMSQAGKLPM